MHRLPSTTDELAGLRVIVPGKGDRLKRVGKVRRFVFHPHERRLLGMLVKRPDLALMFHRRDLFVALDGCQMEDGLLVVGERADASGPAAERGLGVDFRRCVLWVGMPVVAECGTWLGTVGNVGFDPETGAVTFVDVADGAMNDAIVGVRTLPAELVRGFSTGVGAALSAEGAALSGDEGGEEMRGAILVDDRALAIPTQGGAADAAGRAAARAADQVRPVVDGAVQAAGKAVDEGARLTGRQIGRVTGMFSAFRDEYRKAADAQPERIGRVAGRGDGDGSIPAGPRYRVVSDHAFRDAPVAACGDAGKENRQKGASYKVSVSSMPQNEAIGRAVGRHLGQAGGMFSAFKDEFTKASRNDER
ncbi:PRC-barrel domain protein [Eggerthellaceae bacterium zg-1084]|uniref:PRC-barrel domain-containing protein n=1 Tax=Berryella wangjianweii TaxID=2734634 RepID=UPI0015582DDB|nr:PRC-barrel domain protein [Berryella wangjianweii]NPD31083.1 PRC-barrel domain protein [Berryella wangjianweii]NPD31945.1 PRC-barrel domain protein [Eggerthellaceae bacterium zg-997]